MNRKTFSIMAALALMTVAGVASAYAQETKVTAHIPFAFSVSSSTLPAGDYSLGQLYQNAWVIRNDDGSPAIITVVTPNGSNEEANSAKLVFEHCGDRYFLSEVRALGQTTLIPASKAERALEREMARNGSKPETLYVLASLR
jgi:hypothetical protein